MAPEAPATARIIQRIDAAIKGRIISGLLGPGARLPSTRALAAEWGVSRTTVTAAYEQLIAEGYLETRQGARAQVAQGLGRPLTQPGVLGEGPEPFAAEMNDREAIETGDSVSFCHARVADTPCQSAAIV